MADLSREESKRLRAELAEGLGFYPASVAAEDVARYREQIAERKTREEAGERDGWGPGGYKWRRWDHLKEEPTWVNGHKCVRAFVRVDTDDRHCREPFHSP